MTSDDTRTQVVVSMTSFPAAIHFAAPAVASILRGSVLPDKVVLYLTFAQFTDIPIPQELLDLQENNPRFEIRDYDRDIRSYRKLIPALRDFPEAVIVTVDDDTDYDRDMLASLLKMHRRYPEHIFAHRAKRIIPGETYKKWPKYRWYKFLTHRLITRYSTLQTGVAGVLYPPHSLREDMLDAELFTKLAPTTDDIWFWAAAVANGRKIVPVPFGPHNKPKGLGKPRELSLKSVNFKRGADANDVALKTILDHYPIVKQRLEEDD